MSGFGPCNIFIDTVYGKITCHTLSTGYIWHEVVLLRLLADCSKHKITIWFAKPHNTSTITKLTRAFLWPKKQPNNWYETYRVITLKFKDNPLFMILFLNYRKIYDQHNWKIKKLYTSHKSYLFKPVTLVKCILFCVCVCLTCRSREETTLASPKRNTNHQEPVQRKAYYTTLSGGAKTCAYTSVQTSKNITT
jgi:hypothetical protein